MKIVVALAAVLATLAGEARADCLQPLQGEVQASFEVRSCRIAASPRPDLRRFARLRVAKLAVRAVPGPADAPEVVSSYATFVTNLGAMRHVYVDAGSDDACTAFPAGRHVVASVDVLCCDTVPRQGRCALPGPVVRPH